MAEAQPSKTPSPKSTYHAKVAKIVDDNTIVMSAGSTKGVKVGQRVLVFRIGDAIVDPDTKEPLGHVELPVGRGTVIHVQELLSTVAGDKDVSGPVTQPDAVMKFLYGPQGPAPAIRLPFQELTVGDLVRIF